MVHSSGFFLAIKPAPALTCQAHALAVVVVRPNEHAFDQTIADIVAVGMAVLVLLMLAYEIHSRSSRYFASKLEPDALPAAPFTPVAVLNQVPDK